MAHQEINEEQGVREAMVAVGDSGSLHPAARAALPESTIAKFLAQGPGHPAVAYRVTDVEAVCAILRERGLRLLYDVPRRGTSDSRVNFIHPKDAGGVLVELVEPAATRTSALTEVPAACYPSVLSAPEPVRHLNPQEPTCSTSSTRSWPRTPPREDFANLALPEPYRAATVHKDEVDMFEGVASRDKDPRKSLHVEDVALPELGPGEAFVAVMASRDQLQHRVDLDLRAGLDLRVPRALRPARPSSTKRHDLPYHVVGSDLAGVVLATGPGVTKWKPGDRVVAHCLSVELEEPRRPQRHDDGPRSSASGASRPTSAASPTSRWSRPTS